MRHLRTAILTLALLPALVPLSAQDADAPPQDLKMLSIEELAQVDVTSVSRRAEPLPHTAAAVSVIRNDDIRRSGAAYRGTNGLPGGSYTDVHGGHVLGPWTRRTSSREASNPTLFPRSAFLRSVWAF